MVNNDIVDVINPWAGLHRYLPDTCADNVWKVLEIGWSDGTVEEALRRDRGNSPVHYTVAVSSGLAEIKYRRARPDLNWQTLDLRNSLSRKRLARQKFDLVVAPSGGADELGHLSDLIHPGAMLLIRNGNGEDITLPAELSPVETFSRHNGSEWRLLRKSADVTTVVMPDIMEKNSTNAESFPLSDIQHAYWIGRGHSLSLGGVSCHVYFEWHIKGFSLERFERAWNTVISRHGMMRAVVADDGSQRILPVVPPYRIAVDDWRNVAPQELQRLRLEKRDAMCEQVLDAGKWPLFDLRASLEPDDCARVHLDLDLLMFDVQSFHIVLAELERLYRDPQTELPSIGYSFRDYMLAEQHGKQSPGYIEDRHWWLERLHEIAPPPALPLQCQPAEVRRPSFRRLQRRMDPAQWQRLAARAGEAGLTPSAMLLAAFSEVLARWSSEARFTLNLTHFNRRRHHPDVAHLVGDFTSVLLLSVDCAESPGFSERAAAIQTQLWTRLAHTRFGGVELLRELARSRGMTDSSAMPIVFTSLLGMDLDTLVSGADLLGEPDFLYTATPQVWLDHQVMVRKGSLEYNWIVIDELFPPGMIDVMFDCYGEVLDRLTDDNLSWQQPLPVPLPSRQRSVREAVNATRESFALAPLHAGFFRIAAQHAETAAILTPDSRITYRELADGALRIAAALQGLALPAGAPVMLALEKGIDQIAASLGILAAGHILVPLADNLPPARLVETARQADAAAFIAQDTLRAGLPHLPGFDPAGLSEKTQPLDSPLPVSLDAVAYIIFTSGSTGTPKGVAMSHRATANTIADVNRRIGLNAGDRVFGISALSFDLAIYDVFATLGTGATLVLPAPDALRDAAHWLELIHRHTVTVWNSVPALLAMLLEQARTQNCPLPRLRWALLSGDWIPLDLPQQLRDSAPQTRLLAMGGATEAAIWSNWFEVDDVPAEWRSIPYGFPLANQSYRICDGNLHDRPDWVAGDLYIGGAGLAEGYWRDEARTSAAFITDPANGEKLYRTGDLACYWPDGCIEFLGRVDTQVKIGGYRIELGEIENLIGRLPEVKNVAASVWETPGGGRSLAAYVVPRDNSHGISDPVWRVVVEAADSADTHLPEQTRLKSLQRFQQSSEELAGELIVAHLLSLGFPLRDGVAVSWRIDEWAAKLGIAPRFLRLLHNWHRILTEDGILVRRGDVYHLAHPLPDAVEQEKRNAELRDAVMSNLDWVDDSSAFGEWIFASSAAIPKVLREPELAAALLFPDGDSRASESLYQRNIVADHLGAVAAAALQAHLRGQRAAGQTLTPRVLEIGAGVGGLSVSTIPAFASAAPDGEYHYTDVSPYFASLGEAKFGDFPGFRTGHYDINRAAAEQRYAPGSFDAILASNVLHNAHDLVATLSDIGMLLKPGGILLILEATSDKRLQWVTAAAVLEQAADGGENDSDSPLRPETEWRESLAAAGLGTVTSWPAAGSPLVFVGQQVFAALRPALPSAIVPSALRALLASQLPGYMVPEHYVYLDRLPLSSNGKVDRKRLPVPVTESSAAQVSGEKPLPGGESALAAIWCDILRIPSVYRHQDFFAAGGDSLLITRLAARLSAERGVAVPVRLLFEHAGLADQAAALEQLSSGADHAAAWSPLIRLNETAAATLVCVHASDGFAAPYRSLAATLAGRVHCIGLQANGFEPGQRVLNSIAEQADCYLDALRRDKLSAPWHLLGWSMGAYVAMEMAQRLHAAGEEVASLTLVDPAPQAAIAPGAASEFALWQSLASLPLQAEIAATGIAAAGFTALPTGQRLGWWRQALSDNPLVRNSDDAALERMIAVLHANVVAMTAYRLQPLPDVPVTVYTASEHPQAWGDILAPLRAILPERAQCHIIEQSTHWSIVAAPEIGSGVR